MNKKLTLWSAKEFSHLPWREERSLYTTLVSEIMLQQTTVSTVLKHYKNFLGKFPTLADLAKASEAEVSLAWQGLGYYRRARNLRNAAIEIQEKFRGEFPLEFEKLTSIKGIGEYTAGAIRAIGANKVDLAIDANLERVIARYYGYREVKGPTLQKAIRRDFQAEKICQEVREFGGRAFNESLMDLGRVYCRANMAACELCPLGSTCATRGTELPIQKEKAKSGYELHLLRLIVIKEDKILAYRKKAGEWLQDQYEIPTFQVFSEDNSLTQYPVVDYKYYNLLPHFKSAITKYKISNFIMIANEADLQKLDLDLRNYQWVKKEGQHFSTGSHKSLRYF